MGDLKSYIEIVVFLLGWAAVLGAMRQNQNNLSKNLDDGQNDMRKRSEAISSKVDEINRSVGILDSRTLVQANDILALKSGLADQRLVILDREKANDLMHDEIKGDVNRLARQANKLDRWRTAADQQFRRLDGGWNPPVNGD